MINLQYASLRLFAVLKKEFIQIKRDYKTYLFLIFVPFLEVILFGYIINTDAKHLPTIIVSHDNSAFSNTLIEGFRKTEYFKIKSVTDNEKEAVNQLKSGAVQFVVNIPENFERDLIAEKKPHILVEGDASDPVAVGNAFNAANALQRRVFEHLFQGPLSSLKSESNSFVIDTHAVYNPSTQAQLHTVPGLLSTLLTLTLVMLTAISITSEFEHGTMEVLLITPLRTLEVILGKIIPHIMLGYILFFLTILLSVFLFHVPFNGSLILLSLCAIPFMISNLGVGIAVSTVSRTQFSAANIANTYNLPSTLLSGFMFPFYAMPLWAQWIGEMLPPTHFLRITIAIMLKGATFTEVWGDLWPIIAFSCVIIAISFKYYRKTLD